MEKVYLLSYAVNGIKNINHKTKLEFYKKSVGEEFDPSKYRVKAIYGENGTGKSAIVTSVKILKNLITNNYYLTDSNKNELLKDLINKKTRELIIETEFLVGLDEFYYVYKYLINIIYNKNTDHFYIKHEKLDVKNSSSYKNIYEIVEGKMVDACDKSFFNSLNKENGIDTLKNASFIRNYFNDIKNKEHLNKTLNDSERKLILGIASCMIFGCDLYVYLDDGDKYDSYIEKKSLLDYLEHNILSYVPKFSIYSSDNFVIEPSTTVYKEDYQSFENDVQRIYEFIKLFKPELKKIEIEKIENKEKYECSLLFVYDGYKINSIFESNGVKKLIRLYKAIDAVDKGCIVFIDEFDSNIHDVYLCKLIEYIKKYAKGQLCFTSQSITIMEALEDGKKSIDFISRNGEIISWVNNSHYPAPKKYKEGYVRNSPFNIEAFDFIKAFGDMANEQ